MISFRSHVLLMVALAVALALPGLLLSSNYHLRIGALVHLTALVVVGLNLLMGFAGQVSLGQAGFFAIGAYAAAILPARYGLDPLLGAGCGVVLAALVAWLVGKPILRLRGHYLAVATLGFGMLVTLVLTNEVGLTGGPDGMSVKRAEIFGIRLRDPQTWYFISATLLFLGILAAFNLLNSPTGRALKALHDSPVAAQVLGVDVARYKLIVFVIAAIYAALAGAAFALFNGHVTPDAGGFLKSVEFVTMAAIGGLGSVLGGLIGAAILVILPQGLTLFQEYETLLLGLIIIAFMIFMREGIAPAIGRLVRRRLS